MSWDTIRHWGGFPILASFRSVVWTVLLSTPFSDAGWPCCFCRRGASCIAVFTCDLLSLCDQSLAGFFAAPLASIECVYLVMQAHSVGSGSVLAVLHWLCTLVAFHLAAGKGTQMVWNRSVTLQFGVMSKPQDSKLWKRCKCECSGKIKGFFILLVDYSGSVCWFNSR